MLSPNATNLVAPSAVGVGATMPAGTGTPIAAAPPSPSAARSARGWLGLSCTPPSGRRPRQPRMYVWPNSEPSHHSTIRCCRRVALRFSSADVLVVALASARRVVERPRRFTTRRPRPLLRQRLVVRSRRFSNRSNPRFRPRPSRRTPSCAPCHSSPPSGRACWSCATRNLLRFATKSDDGSWLWIDDRLVIDNGGVHGPQNVDAEVFLERGVHAFRVRYLEAGGGTLLQLGQWAGGGHFLTPDRSSRTSVTYGNCAMRELWPLALVAFVYAALLGLAALASLDCRGRRSSRLAHRRLPRPVVPGAWRRSGSRLPSSTSITASVATTFSGDELMPLDTLGASRYLFAWLEPAMAVRPTRADHAASPALCLGRHALRSVSRRSGRFVADAPGHARVQRAVAPGDAGAGLRHRPELADRTAAVFAVALLALRPSSSTSARSRISKSRISSG